MTTHVNDTIDTTTVSLVGLDGARERGGYELRVHGDAEQCVAGRDHGPPDTGDITIADGRHEGTLTIARARAMIPTSTPRTKTATITSTSGGNFENLVVGTALGDGARQRHDRHDDGQLSASTVLENAADTSYVFTATLSNASQGVTTVHTDLGDITIADGASTGTLTIAAGQGDDPYLDASMKTATITSTSGGNFENLVVGTGSATAHGQRHDRHDDGQSVGLDGARERGGYELRVHGDAEQCVAGRDHGPHRPGDITIADGASTGTLTIASGQGDDPYLDASMKTATITSTSGGNFENLVVGTGSATAHVNDTIDTTTVNLSASTVLENAADTSYVFTATLSNASQGVTTVHTDTGRHHDRRWGEHGDANDRLGPGR